MAVNAVNVSQTSASIGYLVVRPSNDVSRPDTDLWDIRNTLSANNSVHVVDADELHRAAKHLSDDHDCVVVLSTGTRAEAALAAAQGSDANIDAIVLLDPEAVSTNKGQALFSGFAALTYLSNIFAGILAEDVSNEGLKLERVRQPAFLMCRMRRQKSNQRFISRLLSNLGGLVELGGYDAHQGNAAETIANRISTFSESVAARMLKEQRLAFSRKQIAQKVAA